MPHLFYTRSITAYTRRRAQYGAVRRRTARCECPLRVMDRVIPLSHRMRWQRGPLRQRPPQPAANVRVANAEHRVGTAAIRRRPHSISKKLNMFNFCRRLLRWILHRVDTVVQPQTPCLYRVCTAENRGVVRLHFCHQFLVLPYKGLLNNHCLTQNFLA